MYEAFRVPGFYFGRHLIKAEYYLLLTQHAYVSCKEAVAV